MKDVLKMCQCGKEHYYGIVGRRFGVPLYGGRPIDTCKEFREDTEESRALTTMDAKEVKELWSATSFLNPQVPTATRKAVNAIIEAGKGKKGMLARVFGGGDKSVMERQWPEFMGLMISQLTDMRGAMVRDDSKFAHLVAHTDEIVEAMRGVVQLEERLSSQNEMLKHLIKQVAELSHPAQVVDYDAMDHFGLAVEPPLPCNEQQPLEDPEELARLYREMTHLRDEVISTDVVNVSED